MPLSRRLVAQSSVVRIGVCGKNGERVVCFRGVAASLRVSGGFHLTWEGWVSGIAGCCRVQR